MFKKLKDQVRNKGLTPLALSEKKEKKEQIGDLY